MYSLFRPICARAQAHACVRECVCVCIYVCVHMCVCVHICMCGWVMAEGEGVLERGVREMEGSVRTCECVEGTWGEGVWKWEWV